MSKPENYPNQLGGNGEPLNIGDFKKKGKNPERQQGTPVIGDEYFVEALKIREGVEQGGEQDVVEYLRSALHVNPYHPGALRTLGNILYKKGEYAKAADYLMRSLDVDRFNPQAMLDLAYVYSDGRIGNNDEITQLVEEAMEAAPNDQFIYFRGAKLLENINPMKSLSMFKKILVLPAADKELKEKSAEAVERLKSHLVMK